MTAEPVQPDSEAGEAPPTGPPTVHELDILTRYGAGKSVDQIVTDTGYGREMVAGTLMHRVTMNRQRAAHLVKEHRLAAARQQRAAEQRRSLTPVAADDPADVTVDVPVERRTDRADDLDISPKPWFRRPINGIEDLIAAADQAGGAPARIAARVKLLLDDLHAKVGEAARQHELRAAIAAMEEDLAAKRAELRRLGTGPTPAVAAREEARAARAWAKANRVACPSTGRVPIAVLDAYRNRNLPAAGRKAAR